MLFPGTTIPKLPEGFVDRSYGNDVCAHYEKEWNGYIISVWVNYDNPDRREVPEQYMIDIRLPEESESIEYVLFDTETIDQAELRIDVEVSKLMQKYKGGTMGREQVTYDKSEFFEAIALMHQYQVGDKYYILHDGKIVESHICYVGLEISDRGMTHTVQREWIIKMEITVLCYSDTKRTKKPSELFKTREEAGDAFLKANDIPAELLKVIMPEKPKTTVRDLIEKLNQVNPDTDLEGNFKPILKRVENKYMKHLSGTTSEYWDCECSTKYIHPSDGTDEYCHECETLRSDGCDSLINEIKPENMARRDE